MPEPWCVYCAQRVLCLDDACQVRARRARDAQTLSLADSQEFRAERAEEKARRLRDLLRRWYVQRYSPGKGGSRADLVRETRAEIGEQD